MIINLEEIWQKCQNAVKYTRGTILTGQSRKIITFNLTQQAMKCPSTWHQPYPYYDKHQTQKRPCILIGWITGYLSGRGQYLLWPLWTAVKDILYGFQFNKQSRKQEPKGTFYARNVVVVKIIIKPKMWKLIFKIPPPPKLAWRSAMWWRHYQAAILKEVCYISEMAIRTTTKEYSLSLYRVITIFWICL